MRTSTELSNRERVHNHAKPKGNWMQLTIAPLVAERVSGKEPMPGRGQEAEQKKPAK